MYRTLPELAHDLLGRGGILLRVRGRPIPFTRCRHDPSALLGMRFGPAIDAVAITLGSHGAAPGDGLVLAVDRCGEVAIVDSVRRSPNTGAALGLDLARRAMGLATAPSPRPVSELVDAIWLDRALRATLEAPLGEPPRWPALARLHPRNPGGAVTDPTVLRQPAAPLPTWSELRQSIIDGTARWPPVSAPLACWFDDGSLARHVFGVLVEPERMIADLDELLRPADVAILVAALNR